jgi:hypothetical protein
VLDQQPGVDQAGRQPAVVEGPPVGLADGLDLAMEDAVTAIDLAAGIAEGGRLA